MSWHAAPLAAAGMAALVAVLAGCGGGGAEAEPRGLPAEVALGQRLFRETRFAQFFAARCGTNVNVSPPPADPVLATTITARGSLPLPAAGPTMSCSACHLSTEAATVYEGGLRNFSDFAPGARSRCAGTVSRGRRATRRRSPGSGRRARAPRCCTSMASTRTAGRSCARRCSAATSAGCCLSRMPRRRTSPASCARTTAAVRSLPTPAAAPTRRCSGPTPASRLSSCCRQALRIDVGDGCGRRRPGRRRGAAGRLPGVARLRARRGRRLRQGALRPVPRAQRPAAPPRARRVRPRVLPAAARRRPGADRSRASSRPTTASIRAPSRSRSCASSSPRTSSQA